MLLGTLPVPVHPTNLDYVGQRLTALAVGAGVVLAFLSLVYLLSCKLKYCLKGPLNLKQQTNQITRSVF